MFITDAKQRKIHGVIFAETPENVICAYVIPMLGKNLEILNVGILNLTLNNVTLILLNRSFIYQVKSSRFGSLNEFFLHKTKRS